MVTAAVSSFLWTRVLTFGIWGKFFFENVVTVFNRMTLLGGAWRGRNISFLILTLLINCDYWLVSLPSHFISGCRTPFTHWIECSVKLRAGPDPIKISSLCRERTMFYSQPRHFTDRATLVHKTLCLRICGIYCLGKRLCCYWPKSDLLWGQR